MHSARVYILQLHGCPYCSYLNKDDLIVIKKRQYWMTLQEIHFSLEITAWFILMYQNKEKAITLPSELATEIFWWKKEIKSA